MDSATLALTGRLPFYLLLALVLTWPVTVVLHRIYLNAVRRSMRRVSGSEDMAAVSLPIAPAPGRAAFIDLSTAAAPPAALSLLGQWRRRVRRAAVAYALGGAAYALVMASAELVSEHLSFLPLRFAMLFWVAFWPAVLTVGLVATTTRRAKAGLVAGYLLVTTAIGAAALPGSPDLTWSQVYLPWIIQDVPTTLFLLAYLSRSVRASGPLILLFMFIGLLGSDLLLTLSASSDAALRGTVTLLDYIGSGAVTGILILAATGFFLFAVIGALALVWIRRRYEAKKISDESLTVDSIWIMFAINHAISLVFEGAWWFLAAPVAYLAFALASRALLAREARRLAGQATPRLLLLRSFSIGRASERLFDGFTKYWRRAGSLQMITGADFATRTVDPHELLEFAAGHLSRRFIGDRAALEQRLQERDLTPDGDGRFRINEFFCHDNTWKLVLSRLVQESDVVLMDLRGFTRANAGCLFELGELSRAASLSHVLFIVDAATDVALVAETLGATSASIWTCRTAATPDQMELLRALATTVVSSSAA